MYKTSLSFFNQVNRGFIVDLIIKSYFFNYYLNEGKVKWV